MIALMNLTVDVIIEVLIVTWWRRLAPSPKLTKKSYMI